MVTLLNKKKPPKNLQNATKRLSPHCLTLFTEQYLELFEAFPSEEITESEVLHLALKTLKSSGGARKAYLEEARKHLNLMEQKLN